MGSKNVPSHSVVVDASVARGSGPPESTHPSGARCRDFLMTMRGAGHRLVWNQPIKDEWGKHQSNFAFSWYVSMVQMRKVIRVSDQQDEGTRAAISQRSSDQGVISAMLKDAFLIEAAMKSEHRVASLDDTVRGHFSRLSASCPLIGAILWVNPTKKDESPVDWLENGAPGERTRMLSRTKSRATGK